MLKSSKIENVHIEDLEKICLSIRNTTDDICDDNNIALVSLKLFGYVMEILSHPVMITGSDRSIVYVNKVVEDLTGYSEEEIIGKIPNFFYYREDIDYPEEDKNKDKAFLEEIKRKIAEKKFFTRNFSFYKKDGSKLRLLISYFPVLDKKEKLLFHITTAYELTESGQIDISDVG